MDYDVYRDDAACTCHLDGGLDPNCYYHGERAVDLGPPPEHLYWVVRRPIGWLCLFVTFVAGVAVGFALLAAVVL